MNNKGNSSLIVILFVLVIVIVGASAAAYYLLKSRGVDMATNNTTGSYETTSLKTNSPSASGVSDKNDITTIETELNNTDTGSTDADLQNLDSQATGL